MSRTLRSGTDLFPSEIDLRDLQVVLDLPHRSLGELLALMEDGDLVRDLADEAHVVLDHHDRARARDLLDQLRGRVRLVAGHPGGWLVEQHEPRLRGHHHPDLEPLLLAVGERVRLVGTWNLREMPIP